MKSKKEATATAKSKERLIHELLIILRTAVLESRRTDYPELMYNDGLCAVINHLLLYDGIISENEAIILKVYLYKHRPKTRLPVFDAEGNRLRGYFWELGLIKPRLQWLTRNINKTKY